MNVEIVKSVVRSVLIGATSYGVGKGWFDQALAAEIVAFGITLAVAAWGAYSAKKKEAK